MSNTASVTATSVNQLCREEFAKKDLNRFETFLFQRISRFSRYETDNRKKIVSDMHRLRKVLENAACKTEQYFQCVRSVSSPSAMCS